MPEGFVFPPPVRLPAASALPAGDMWMPFGRQTTSSARDSRILRVFALLAPNATVQGADAEMNLIAEQLRAQYPGTNQESGVRVVSLHDQLVAPVRASLWMLMTGVGLLLLLTCANLSSLLLGRFVARSREMATRLALGAGRSRLIQQVTIENMLLGAVSGGLSLLLTGALLHVLPSVLPPDFPNLVNISIH
ncbi:MAG TPA: FtsX-like permease family protein [Bryobacteraceae bacterium]|nr:FtsX-like permease family protein [Bryobacteraceae bacterium]